MCPAYKNTDAALQLLIRGNVLNIEGFLRNSTKENHTSIEMKTEHNSVFLVTCGKQWKLRKAFASMNMVSSLWSAGLTGQHYFHFSAGEELLTPIYRYRSAGSQECQCLRSLLEKSLRKLWATISWFPQEKSRCSLQIRSSSIALRLFRRSVR
jgi:hypothetical protein